MLNIVFFFYYYYYSLFELNDLYKFCTIRLNDNEEGLTEKFNRRSLITNLLFIFPIFFHLYLLKFLNQLP